MSKAKLLTKLFESATKGGGKPLSRSKARTDLAEVAKTKQGLETTLKAKQDKLKRLRKENAPPDAIEREVNAIEGIKKKLGPISKKKVAEGDVQPLPDRPKPKGKKPKAKPNVSLRNAYENAKNAGKTTFTFQGKKYSVKALKERFAKADKAAGLRKGGIAKKGVPVITVGIGMMPSPKGKKPRTGSKDFRNGGMVTETKDNLNPGLRALKKVRPDVVANILKKK